MTIYIARVKAMPHETTKSPGYYSAVFADCLFTEQEAGIPQGIIGIRKFENNEMLFSAGERPSYIFRLVRGKTRLSFYPGKGRNAVTRLVELNEVLGLSEMILDLPFGADAICLDACACEIIKSTDLRDILQHQPGAGFHLAKVFAETIRKTYKLMLSQ